MSRYPRAADVLVRLAIAIWGTTVEARDFEACQVSANGIREVRLGMPLSELIQRSDVIVRDEFLAGEGQVNAYRIEIPRCDLSLEVWDAKQNGRAGLLIFDSPGTTTVDGVSIGQPVKEIARLVTDFRPTAGLDEGSFINLISNVGIVYSIDPRSFSECWLSQPNWTDERFLDSRISSVMIADFE